MSAQSTGSCWAQPIARVLAAFDSSAAGLTEAQAGRLLQQHGPNRLAEKPPRSPWLLFAEQFRSLLVVVLLAAAVLAGVVGDLHDSVVILLVTLLNAFLGFYQEYRAERSLAALKQMLATRARIRRGNRVAEIAADRLVPGDIVLLEAGDKVPADGRLIEAHSLEAIESALTGESMPLPKQVEALPEGCLLAERSNMAFMNTVISRGRGVLLITATGMATEMGRLTGMLEAAGEAQTPLQLQLDRLGKRLAAIALAVVMLILVLGWMRGQALASLLLTAIALAVAAIPEGLPAVVTVTLALGMRRMAKRRAILKKLAAVETLGCTTVICSDKTGTLTLNQMTARAVFFHGRAWQVSGEGYGSIGQISVEGRPACAAELRPLLWPLALCNDARINDGELIGDPTEGALLALAAKGGVDAAALQSQYPRLAELPFDSAHKFMATCHHLDGELQWLVKGAPDVLLARCSTIATELGTQELNQEWRDRLLAENTRLAGQALRVLAVARKRISQAGECRKLDVNQVGQLELIGLIGLIDPPRPEARVAIAVCHGAGIKVKMITGDHQATASAIASELGLSGEVLGGADLDLISDGELARRVEHVAVFARVSPEHKVRLVRALQAGGHVVAMTGDGVNDAPALKHADIGVAMGISGTEVTKEAASMVLTDDNFATIVNAVREGRTIYENIVKFVRFQLSTNIGAILSVLGASLTGLPAPLSAIQILWINIIMDGPPAMTLGLDPARPGVMQEAPRGREQAILSWARFRHLLAYGLIMAVGSLGLFHHALSAGASETYARTLAFSGFVLFQFFNIFNARSEASSALCRQSLRNGKLWLALLAVLLLQLLVVHWGPAQSIFDTTALSWQDWLLAIGVASSVLLADELRKLARRALAACRT